jgi:glutaredoxin 2
VNYPIFTAGLDKELKEVLARLQVAEAHNYVILVSEKPPVLNILHRDQAIATIREMLTQVSHANRGKFFELLAHRQQLILQDQEQIKLLKILISGSGDHNQMIQAARNKNWRNYRSASAHYTVAFNQQQIAQYTAELNYLEAKLATSAVLIIDSEQFLA